MFQLSVDVVQRILAFAEQARLQHALEVGMEAVRETAARWRANLMRQLRQLPRDGSAERERAEIIRPLGDLDRL